MKIEMTKAQKIRRRKRGYSLVEVSLALLVVAIGLLTTFALFPDGLDLSRKSVDATEAAAFADFVLNSLGGMASSTNAADWSSFTNNQIKLPLTLMLYGATNLPPIQPYIYPKGNSTPQVYYWMPDYYGETDWSVERYSVTKFTYLLDIGQITNRYARYARLEVWPGDVSNQVAEAVKSSSTSAVPESAVFYREYLPLK